MCNKRKAASESPRTEERRGVQELRVGFVGLGNMGSVMARNLIKAGHTLTVYNQARSRAEELQTLGATIARISFREAGL
jgi:prephenate dehydrogenase